MKTILHFLFFFLVILVFEKPALAENDSLFALVQDNRVTLWDMDAHRNCGSMYVMEIDRENQLINWIQRDTGDYAYCYCTFDYSVTFGPLEAGLYSVNVYYTEPDDSSLNVVGISSFNISDPLLDSTVYFKSFSSNCGGINLGMKDILKATDATLGQNFPNPFVDQTTIPFSPASGRRHHLVITNTLGTIIRSIPLPDDGEPGITISRQDKFGKRLPAGVYFYQLDSPGTRAIHRMIILD
jgi:hypothetical protein